MKRGHYQREIDSCPGLAHSTLSRRAWLQKTAGGFGMLALSALMNQRGLAGIDANPLPHFKPKIRSVIFCFMDGGVSHVDSFDPKPKLTELHGKAVRITREQDRLTAGNRKWLGSPWKFRAHGQSAIPISDLFPQLATCADDLTIVRSMVGEFPLHSRGNLLAHTGRSVGGHPSLGAWISYGLGTENQNLPGFVVLHNGMNIPSGLENFASAFLPASHQASLLRTAGNPMDNLTPAEGDGRLQLDKLRLLKDQDQEFLAAQQNADAVEAAIGNYELAYRMQSLVPDVVDLSKESKATQKLYGIDAKNTNKSRYGMQCLRARRMVEAGVRFVEVTCPLLYSKNGTWDQHGGLRKGHEGNAMVVDQAIAGLLKDLKSRGMLDETLVLWSGEFGRTPHSGGSNGRDHHPAGFTLWMAGGGLKPGFTYGATDELGMKSVHNVTTFHDLHATILHLLGLDHEKLTYRYGGRDFRLTDVHGRILRDVLA